MGHDIVFINRKDKVSFTIKNTSNGFENEDILHRFLKMQIGSTLEINGNSDYWTEEVLDGKHEGYTHLDSWNEEHFEDWYKKQIEG